MRQTKQHKPIFINTLEIFDETFETNETVFLDFYALSLILHIFNPLFAVSFCLKSVSFCLILSHSVSFQKTLITKYKFPNTKYRRFSLANQILNTQYKILNTKRKMGLSQRHKLLIINILSDFNGTFGTNGTIFHCFHSLSLFLHIFNTLFVVPFCPNSFLLVPIRPNQSRFKNINHITKN